MNIKKRLLELVWIFTVIIGLSGLATWFFEWFFFKGEANITDIKFSVVLLFLFFVLLLCFWKNEPFEENKEQIPKKNSVEMNPKIKKQNVTKNTNRTIWDVIAWVVLGICGFSVALICFLVPHFNLSWQVAFASFSPVFTLGLSAGAWLIKTYLGEEIKSGFRKEENEEDTSQKFITQCLSKWSELKAVSQMEVFDKTHNLLTNASIADFTVILDTFSKETLNSTNDVKLKEVLSRFSESSASDLVDLYGALIHIVSLLPKTIAECLAINYGIAIYAEGRCECLRRNLQWYDVDKSNLKKEWQEIKSDYDRTLKEVGLDSFVNAIDLDDSQLENKLYVLYGELLKVLPSQLQKWYYEGNFNFDVSLRVMHKAYQIDKNLREHSKTYMDYPESLAFKEPPPNVSITSDRTANSQKIIPTD